MRADFLGDLAPGKSLAPEDGSTSVVEGARFAHDDPALDRLGAAQRATLSDERALQLSKHAEQLKETKSYDAAVNCLLRRGA